MYHEILTKLFKKFKKEELLDILVERGFLDESFRDDVSGNKMSVVNRVAKACGGKFTERHVAMLDLIYQQVHNKTKKWDVYYLAGFDPVKSNASVLSDPAVFEARMHAQLKLYFSLSLCVQQWENALWMRLAICDKMTSSLSASSSSNIVYVIHYPHSPYLITTNIKAAHKQYIFQALADVLHGDVVQKMSLSGKDVKSLADMVLNRHSQGSFSQYRLSEVDTNPLVCCKKRKHNQDNTNDDGNDTNDVCNENISDKRRKQIKINNVFGSNTQPVLEKVEFLMHTRFRGTRYVAHHKKPFRCSVKFEGPSVIEGIKNLGTQDIASLPLPSHLANLHSFSRSHFLLTDRKRVKTMAEIQDENSKPLITNSSINHE